jgi:hypothetical protein
LFFLVLKLRTSDHGLVLVPSVALTRQKWVVLPARPLTAAEVPVTDWSYARVPNVELVDTWAR